MSKCWLYSDCANYDPDSLDCEDKGHEQGYKCFMAAAYLNSRIYNAGLKKAIRPKKVMPFVVKAIFLGVLMAGLFIMSVLWAVSRSP